MIKTPIFPLAMLAVSALSACMPAPAMNAPELPVQPIIPTAGVAQVEGVAGLQERQPDLCGAGAYKVYVGQPGGIVPTLGITKNYRIVEFRGIEPQEYDPNRIVFRLDGAGNVQAVDCG